jgi:hypothetical protein
MGCSGFGEYDMFLGAVVLEEAHADDLCGSTRKLMRCHHRWASVLAGTPRMTGALKTIQGSTLGCVLALSGRVLSLEPCKLPGNARVSRLGCADNPSG